MRDSVRREVGKGQRNRGFTLVELLVSSGILAAMFFGAHGLLSVVLGHQSRNEANRLLYVAGETLVESIQKDARLAKSHLASYGVAGNGETTQPYLGADLTLVLDMPSRYIANPATDPTWGRFAPPADPTATPWLQRRITYYLGLADSVDEGYFVRVTQLRWTATNAPTSWAQLGDPKAAGVGATRSTDKTYWCVKQRLSRLVYKFEGNWDADSWNKGEARYDRDVRFFLYLHPDGFAARTNGESAAYKLQGRAWERRSKADVDQRISFPYL
ncbi:MAG: prepilin-type N-terminal cleavage/methylation domain-containing protein [Methanocella sp.]